MLPEGRLQAVMALKGAELVEGRGSGLPLQVARDAPVAGEGWHAIDGAIVVFDLEDPPPWLPGEGERDEEGNTEWGRAQADRSAAAR